MLMLLFSERLSQEMDVIDTGVDAVRERLRAVFLTSLTTVAGLMPLLLAQSTQAQLLHLVIDSLVLTSWRPLFRDCSRPR